MIDHFSTSDDQGVRPPITKAFKPARNSLQLFTQLTIVLGTPLVIEAGTIKSDQGATTPR